MILNGVKYMPVQHNRCKTISQVALIICTSLAIKTRADSLALEEVIVTAQKRAESLQELPFAASALSTKQIDALGVTSLDGLADSIVPSLRINRNGLSPSTLTVAIRGDGAADVGQPTRQGSVAIYLDSVYLGRAQGLGMELADLERIEVLRGPQGTLFGRNSTTGALSIISKKPSSEFEFQQTLSKGRFDEFKSLTRVNIPINDSIRIKLGYLHTERDGWVKNSLQGQADFNEYNKDGVRLAINWQLTGNTELDYIYDYSDIEIAQMYYQLYEDLPGFIGRERKRQTETRFPLVLKPIGVETEGHSLIANWELSDNVTFTSITGYRELDEDGFNNHGGTIFYVGLILDEDIKQDQFSQEFQLVGSHQKVDWVTGFFYFREDSEFNFQNFISLDGGFNPINPPFAISELSNVDSEATSVAVYGQGTFSFTEQLHLTIGARYTEDEKSARKDAFVPEDVNTDHIDGTIAISYAFSDDINTYIRWANAYKAGGYNARSVSFLPYEEEVNNTYEVGIKSEWLKDKLRINFAMFRSEFDDKQFDFMDPGDPLVIETLNAVKGAEITGAEMDLIAAITQNMTLGIHYTYLDSDMPLQPHPTEPGFQNFTLSMAPQHAGSFTFDYNRSLKPNIGDLNLHVDISSTDKYSYSNFPDTREDAYTLLNARLSLTNSAIISAGSLTFTIWGRNLTDEEYVILGFPIGTPPDRVNQIFGTPRTAGIEIMYNY